MSENQSLFDVTINEVIKLCKSRQFVGNLCGLLGIKIPNTINPIIENIRTNWDDNYFRGKLMFLIGYTYENGTSY